jgi:hypothetical protein
MRLRKESVCKTSKAILKTPGTMTILPANMVPKDDEVLIKMEYVGICGSDVHGFESGPLFRRKILNQEIGLGHECAGTVVAIGRNVKKFKPGDKVNIEPGVPCGKCRYCLEGKYNICPDVDFMATQPNYRGALTYLCHPESFTLSARKYGHHGGRTGRACGGGDMPRCLLTSKPGKKDCHSRRRLYRLDDSAGLPLSGRHANCGG